ncbi:uncharacterized protein KY384_002789 [Bacidia gigantensis]|uniref:uncharacterized protein n=1 Tax=Bacidia gigantensis TaxID=2732470 RepID=UPI001D04D4E8|nr:uncharacterized protein KY384_002789 [Bacidia gigantensis]KAG8532911.1 hypothetical protein KY384_002789 [Bacidia gigantensis]
MSGVRAIISRGWSNIGDSSARKDIFYLDDCPHEWLFQKVSAVVHHGGAGTTACGLLNARPTVIVPFFGDQPFWGQMIANAKAGPQPIPHKALNSHNLAEAITFCESEETVNVASEIAYKMRDESGVRQAVASFLRQLPRDRLGCELVPGQSANWIYTNCKRPIRISNLAVENLCLSKDVKFKRKHLKHYGPTPILITNKRWDPFTSAGSSGMRVATDLTSSFVGIVADPVKVYLDNNKPGSADKSQLKLHGQAALASARNIDHLAVGAFKGGVVDIPLALAEGFRNAPKLWGQSVKDHGEITGWQSGVAVAGKVRIY